MNGCVLLLDEGVRGIAWADRKNGFRGRIWDVGGGQGLTGRAGRWRTCPRGRGESRIGLRGRMGTRVRWEICRGQGARFTGRGELDRKRPVDGGRGWG